MLRRVRLSLIKKGQWRKKWVMDSISWPQLHKGFNVSWKLCLNLCSLRWLKPSLSLVISLILLGLGISKTEFGEGRMKLSFFSLKTEILLELNYTRSKIPFLCSGNKLQFFKYPPFERTICIDTDKFCFSKNGIVRQYCISLEKENYNDIGTHLDFCQENGIRITMLLQR